MFIDTRASLLQVAIGQVRRQGYAGFSYADLADVVGIRKASIHHHFPTKEDLGVAIVAAYAENFSEELARIEAQSSHVADRLKAFASLYRTGLETGHGCLCGVLASEIAVLPPRVQASVRAFFTTNLRWLALVLEQGVAAGTLDAGIDCQREADTLLAALQGALLVGLSLGGEEYFDRAVAGLFRGLALAAP